MNLDKVTFENMQSFLEIINHNFALIDNSPLFKGIPGPTPDAIPGQQGIRGTKFIFVKMENFINVFPDLSSSPISTINIAFLNNVAQSSYVNLLECLNTSELVNGDVIVLQYNTEMLTFNSTSLTFTSTGMYFNTQFNLLNNIEANINRTIDSMMENIQNQLSNQMFVDYSSVSRNFGIGNSLGDNNFEEDASIYFPVINGLINQNSGTNMSSYENPVFRHKYIGMQSNYFGSESIPTQTTVIGSIRKYAQLMSNASSNNNIQLSTDYAPSNRNLPSMVILQNNLYSGILVGYKGDNDLRKFSSIYKNGSDLIIETDYEPLEANKGVLKLSKLLAEWNKAMKIMQSLSVGSDLVFFNNPSIIGNENNISSPFLRTSKYSTSYNTNTIVKLLDLGFETNGKAFANSFNRIFSDRIKLISSTNGNTLWKNKVLITDENGEILKDKVLENYLSTPDSANLTISKFFQNVNSPNKIVTSDYINQLGKLLWGIPNFDAINNTPENNRNLSNIWYKDQYTGYNIPSIELNKSFVVGPLSNGVRKKYFEIDSDSKKVNVGHSDTDVNLKYNKFNVQNMDEYSVMSFDQDKNATSQHQVSPLTEQQYNNIVNSSTFDQNTFAGFNVEFGTTSKIGGKETTPIENKLLNGKHWKILMIFFDKIRSKFTNYYTKSEVDNMLPSGTIISWTPLVKIGEQIFQDVDDDALPVLIPKGWVPCCGGVATDGTIRYKIPNLVNKFVYGYRPNYIDSVQNEKVLTYCNGTAQAAGYQHYGGKLRDIIGNNQMLLEEKHIPPHLHSHKHKTQTDGNHIHFQYFAPESTTPDSIGFSYPQTANIKSPLQLSGEHYHNVNANTKLSNFLKRISGSTIHPDYFKLSMERENENVILDREGRASVTVPQYSEPSNVHDEIYGGSSDLSSPYYTIKPFRLVSRCLKAFYLYKLPNDFKLTQYTPDYTEA